MILPLLPLVTDVSIFLTGICVLHFEDARIINLVDYICLTDMDNMIGLTCTNYICDVIHVAKHERAEIRYVKLCLFFVFIKNKICV